MQAGRQHSTERIEKQKPSIVQSTVFLSPLPPPARTAAYQYKFQHTPHVHAYCCIGCTVHILHSTCWCIGCTSTWQVEARFLASTRSLFSSSIRLRNSCSCADTSPSFISSRITVSRNRSSDWSSLPSNDEFCITSSATLSARSAFFADNAFSRLPNPFDDCSSSACHSINNNY